MKAPLDKPRPPQCERVKLTTNKQRRRCVNNGVACWVTGEFGRQAKVLCNACIAALRATGWKVRYQLEGDAPPQQETITSN